MLSCVDVATVVPPGATTEPELATSLMSSVTVAPALIFDIALTDIERKIQSSEIITPVVMFWAPLPNEYGSPVKDVSFLSASMMKKPPPAGPVAPSIPVAPAGPVSPVAPVAP